MIRKGFLFTLGVLAAVMLPVLAIVVLHFAAIAGIYVYKLENSKKSSNATHLNAAPR